MTSMKSAAMIVMAGVAACAASARAQQPTEPETTLCKIVWDGETTGRGDTESAHGEFPVTRGFPNGDGGYMAFASGEATVTYRTSAAGCTIVSGSPYKAKFDVILSSDDGKTAQVDISAQDESYKLTLACNQQGIGRLRNVPTGGAKQSINEVEPADPPTIKVPLKPGSTDYSESRGPRGRKGTLTLQYCPKDKQ